jgi:restriction endonuclease S subunit
MTDSDHKGVNINLDSLLNNSITQNKRTKGIYPYYGASGIVDYVDSYIVDDFVLLVSEDGANLKTRNLPIAFTVEGKAWVNNHAHIIKFKNKNTHKLVECYLNRLDLTTYITGQAQPKLNQKNLHEIKVPLPSIEIQKEIVSKIQKLEIQINESKRILDSASDKKKDILKKYL